MASSTSYNQHPLPAPPLQQDPSYTPYHQQLPAAQDRQYPSRNYSQQQTQYQQQPQYRQQQQREHQQQLPPPGSKTQQPPPPPPPPQPQQQQQRVRPKSRAFSFRSDKSQKGVAKEHLVETTKEKEARRLHSKADPTMALSEREPAMEAQMVSVRPALRSIQYKDLNGNPIADPDRSNPTRSRWERPLDTIRAFEAAIDDGYNRKSMYKPDMEPVISWNRRSSYYGSEQKRVSPSRRNRISQSARPDNGRSQDSWYGGRSHDQRQSVMVGGSRESSYEGLEGGPYNNGGPNMGPRNKYSRHQSEPHLNNGRERNVYPIPNNHRSYETVASGSGSGSMGEPQGYQTDPTSSENSSINRRSPPKRQEPMNDYGISFGQSPSYQTPGADVGETRSENPPSLPRKEVGSLLKKPSQSAVSNGKAPERPDLGDKRKSWFVRRFSKNS